MSVDTNRSVASETETCDGCGGDGPLGRYYERTGTMTYRRVRWLCRSCHPGGI